jgi:acyl carrier protein
MTNRETLRQELATILENEKGVTPSHLDDETNLRSELELDSVDLISLAMCVESKYRIRLDQEELQAINTVGNLLDSIENHFNGKAMAKAA